MLTVGASTARTIECARCNAAFSVEAVAAEVLCPFCGHTQPVAEHAELAAYQADIGRRVAAANQQHELAAAIEAWNASRSSDPRRNLAMVYGLMLGAPFALAMLLIGLDAVGLLPRTRGPGIALALGATSFLGLGAYFVWYFTGRARRTARTAELAPVRVACPTCGAPGALTPGDDVDTCGYCNAALIPSRTVIRQGLDAARVAHRQAAIARRRAQRISVARATNLGGWNVFMPVVMFGSVIAMLGASAVGFSIQMLTGDEPYSPAIFLLWAMTLAVAGGVAQYVSRRRARKRALAAALADIARQLGGTAFATANERVQWLNAFWAGDYEQQHLIQTYVAGSAGVDVGGYRALVDVDLHDSRPPPRLHLLLAAWIPEYSEGKQPTKRLKDPGLKDLGFLVYRTQGGLEARAQPPLLDACRKDPGAVHVVVTALSQLAALAQRHGFDSVDAAA